MYCGLSGRSSGTVPLVFQMAEQILKRTSALQRARQQLCFMTQRRAMPPREERDKKRTDEEWTRLYIGRHERQGLNHAARPDRPIAFSGRTLCIFCGRGNRLGIGGKIVLVMQTPSASQTGNTDGAVSFGGTTFSDSPLPGCRSTCPPL